MTRWFSACTTILVLGVAASGCNENNHSGGSGSSSSGSDSTNPGDTLQALPPAFSVELQVRDESSLPVSGATVRVDGVDLVTDGNGRLTLPNLDQPVLAVVEANGFFPEPVAVGRGDVAAVVSLQLLRRTGANGERRVVMHFGGDSMLGRRYTDPGVDGTSRVSTRDGGGQAREVVRALAPLFTAADVRALNFESLISDLPLSLGYPRKRFLIQSPPETALPALQLLETNVLNLANNHGYDWAESGVIATQGSLAGTGIPYFGVGSSETEAAAPLSMTAGGLKIGFLGYTTINGDVINDALPVASTPVPNPLSASQSWKYELRLFGFSQGAVTIAEAPRRAGTAWRLFRDTERGGLTGPDLDAFWAELSAVYPELQDLVARRGHGGTNEFDPDKVVSDVAALRSSGHDLVVVQLHGGFEYSEHKSVFVERAAHTSIDAGADLFVGHHPHTLNGVEFYKGKLVVHSLGNFFFDQDLFVTFASAMLRVVFEEGQVLESRIYPLTIDDYRPAPLVNQAAEQIVRLMNERSAIPARAERDSDKFLRSVLRTRSADVVAPEFVLENNSARLIAPVTSGTPLAVQVPAGETVRLTGHRVTRSRTASGGPLNLDFGRDLYRGWGNFEDFTADLIADSETHWQLNTTTHRAEAVANAPDGFGVLRMRRVQTNVGRTTTLPRARAPLLRTRYYTDAGASFTPASDDARYSVRFSYNLSGEAPLELRFLVYAFVDPDPFILPETRFLRELSIPVDLISDGDWHVAEIDLPLSLFAPDTDGAEPVFGVPILDLYPSTTPEAVLLVDTLQLFEWHTSNSLPDSFFGVDALRTSGSTTGVVTLEQR